MDTDIIILLLVAPSSLDLVVSTCFYLPLLIYLINQINLLAFPNFPMCVECDVTFVLDKAPDMEMIGVLLIISIATVFQVFLHFH